MPKTRVHRKLRVQNFANRGDSIRDPQITEEAYQLLAQGASPKDLLTVVTPPAMAEYAARPTPPPHRFKFRGPLKDHIPELDAFLAAGFAAGVPLIVMMSQVLPSIDDDRAAKAARIKEENERATAKRMARIAAQNDPEKRERERVSFQKRMKETARKKAARLERLEAEAKKKALALAENPTLAWRHPRRRGWLKPLDDSSPAKP